MATISVLNTSANLSGKTILSAENDYTITGNHTFDRDPSAPFTVTASSAVVTNLDADKLDGLESTVFARWDGLGTSSGQIAFPAAQSASTGVNVLDDYEEGTWTPVIGGDGGTSGQTYTLQAGTYVKIGQFCMAQYYAVLSAKGTITGGVQIQGQPFAAVTSANARWVHSVKWANLATNWVEIIGQLDSAGTAQDLLGSAAASGTVGTGLATADINNNTSFAGVIIYRTTT